MKGEMSASCYVSLAIFSLPAQHGGSLLIPLLLPDPEAWHERMNGQVQFYSLHKNLPCLNFSTFDILMAHNFVISDGDCDGEELI